MPAWNAVLDELNKHQMNAMRSLDLVRHKYLKALHKQTGRNVIAYYSAFLNKKAAQTDITNEDLGGFMMAVHGMDRSKGLDLILHTPGGSVASTQSIVHYLRQMFGKDIRAVVPHIAMSAGTMIACSCKKIVMAKHSQLGPTDPHISGIPAAGVAEEFKRACAEIRKDPSVLPLWQVIIGQYHPTFLSACENAVKRASEFVAAELERVMLDGKPSAKTTANRIVKKLNDYSGNKGHDRPIHIAECREMGLDVDALEDDNKFQDLVLTVHHCYMHAFTGSRAYKIIENHNGVATIKQLVDPAVS
jgi:hypothetical protein